jgi:mono/diheme cytochrome c family protein
MCTLPLAAPRMTRLRLSIATALVAVLPSVAPAADPDRGRELYESACIGCHGRSVHARAQSSVRTCPELRATITRFANIQGRNWDAEDVADVTAWLNLRYYGFPMHEGRCLAVIAGARVLRAAAP